MSCPGAADVEACDIAVPPLGEGQVYALESHVHEISEREEAARVQLELMASRHEEMMEQARAAADEAGQAKQARKDEKKRTRVLKKLGQKRERLKKRQGFKKKPEEEAAKEEEEEED